MFRGTGRRQSLPSGITSPQSQTNSKIIVATQDGKVYWALVNSLLEGESPDWANIPAQKSEKILKLVLSNDTIYTVSNSYVSTYAIKAVTIEKINCKSNLERGDGEKYIDLEVALQVFVIKETRRHIGMI